MRASSKRSSTSDERRRPARARTGSVSSGAARPSSSASSIACMFASGVRRSWLAQATSSRRASNSRSRLAAISLNDAARSATSAGPDSGARTREVAGRERAPTRRARDRRSCTIERARTSPATTATAADAADDGEDLHVVAHVERDPAGEQHRGERQADRERGEPGELEPQAREEAQEAPRRRARRRASARPTASAVADHRDGRSRHDRGSRRPRRSGGAAASTGRPRSSRAAGARGR